MKQAWQLGLLLWAAMFLMSCGNISGVETDSGRVRGMTKNAETGAFLRNVTVEVDGVYIRTDDTGLFLLDGVELGEQRVIASKPGYQTYECLVEVTLDATAFLNIEMLPDTINP